MLTKSDAFAQTQFIRACPEHMCSHYNHNSVQGKNTSAQNKTNNFLTYSVFIENFTLYKHSIYKKQKYLALCYLFTQGYTYLKTYKMLKSTLYKITNVRMATSIFATV